MNTTTGPALAPAVGWEPVCVKLAEQPRGGSGTRRFTPEEPVHGIVRVRKDPFCKQNFLRSPAAPGDRGRPGKPAGTPYVPQLCCLVPPADGGPTGLAQSRLDSVGGGPGPLWAGREGAGPSPRSWTGVQRLKTRSPATCPLGPYLQVSLEVDSGVLRGSLPSGKPGRQWGACGCRHPTHCLCPLQSHRLRVQALTPCSPRCPSTALAPHPLLRDGGWASRDTSQPLATALPRPAPRCHSGGGRPSPQLALGSGGSGNKRSSAKRPHEDRRLLYISVAAAHSCRPSEARAVRRGWSRGRLPRDWSRGIPGHASSCLVCLGKWTARRSPRPLLPTHRYFFFLFFFPPSRNQS